MQTMQTKLLETHCVCFRRPMPQQRRSKRQRRRGHAAHIAAYRLDRIVPIYHHGVFIETGFYREFTHVSKYSASIARLQRDKALWESSARLTVSGTAVEPLWIEIETDENDLVIDFDDKGMHLTTYANFKNGCKLYKIDNDSAYRPDIIYERAIDYYLHVSRDYHVIKCNCESVTNEIVTGEKTSHQVKRVLPWQ